jgi:hypothetical protein
VKDRFTLSVAPGLAQKAKILMAHLDFSAFNEFIEQLIRNEWDQRKAELSGKILLGSSQKSPKTDESKTPDIST